MFVSKIRTTLVAIVFGLAVMVVVSGIVTKSVQAGTIPAWKAKTSPSASGKKATFYCPKAYLGIRGDLLPTHWEVFKGNKPLPLKSSQVQGQDMVCVYGEPGQPAEGSVRRLVPAGYKCISDGTGTFKCEKKGR